MTNEDHKKKYENLYSLKSAALVAQHQGPKKNSSTDTYLQQSV
jgi:hypothetical protein